MSELSKRRWWPRVHYTNYQNKYGPAGGFKRWFYIDRFWYGRIIHIGVRHYAITLDFRGDWLADMAHQPKGGPR